MDFFCIDPSPFLCVLISFFSGGFSLTPNPYDCFYSYNLLEWYVASSKNQYLALTYGI